MSETYWMAHDAVRTIRPFARFRARRGARFTERIMLAVTEVNGCAPCAYAHTRFALAAGMDADEVRRMLGGLTDGAPADELAAIAFAQHYADARGHPDRNAWDRLVETYGDEAALGMLGAARVMMLGNALAIPQSSLVARLCGRPHPGSTLRHEVSAVAGGPLVVPFAAVHGLVSSLRGRPVIRFTASSVSARDAALGTTTRVRPGRSPGGADPEQVRQ